MAVAASLLHPGKSSIARYCQSLEPPLSYLTPPQALVFLPSPFTCFALSPQACRLSSSPSWRRWCPCFRSGCSSSSPSWCLPSSGWSSTWASFTKPASLTRRVSVELHCHPNISSWCFQPPQFDRDAFYPALMLLFIFLVYVACIFPPFYPPTFRVNKLLCLVHTRVRWRFWGLPLMGLFFS